LTQVGLFERCAFAGKYNRLVYVKNYKMINLLEEDGIVDAVVMVVVLADAVLVGVDVAVLFVSSKR